VQDDFKLTSRLTLNVGMRWAALGKFMPVEIRGLGI
jgi:hypothetical protein